jgi:hypothetical protein
MRTSAGPRRRAGRGAYTVEFAMVTLIFLGVVFCVIEVARAMYLWNTLPVVMQRAARAAAVTAVTDADALDRVRRGAVGGGPGGQMPLGEPLTQAHVRIDYLAADQTVVPLGQLPATPRQHLLNCINNFDGSSPGVPACIRFVRARLCAPGGYGSACGAVQFQPLLPLVELPITFPPFTVLVKAESLGYLPP